MLPSLDELRERVALHLTAAAPGDVLPLLPAADDMPLLEDMPPLEDVPVLEEVPLLVDMLLPGLALPLPLPGVLVPAMPLLPIPLPLVPVREEPATPLFVPLSEEPEE